MSLSSICVYCSSRNAVAEKFQIAAHDLGTQLAKRGKQVIYGGGRLGLMGIVADAALAAGGKVCGIIPELLKAREVQHTGLTELHIVPDMHSRKRMMVERADAFVILPGGLGTLDETFEIVTWKMLKLHDKPIILVNIDGYWDELIVLLNKTVSETFTRPDDIQLLTVVPTVALALDALETAFSSDQKTLSDRM